ncbi:MAG: agmatine/peptidylarginine deiminase [Acidimicrobiales bacterium]
MSPAEEPPSGAGDTSPAAQGFVMAPDWAPHRRTWMSWPTHNYVREAGPATLAAWAAVAAAVSRFEPLCMLTAPSTLQEARAACPPGTEVVSCKLDDAWLRDNGPTFLLDGHGRVGSVNWSFNAWGGRFPFQRDRAAGVLVADRSGAVRSASPLVNEGGAMVTDGAGTLIVTESVLTNPNRNPGWNRAAVEAELRRVLGVGAVIWLSRGLHGDVGPNGTDGHADTLTAFVGPGVVVAHHQPDPDHPDHEITADNLARLRAARDAGGRPLEVVALPAPASGREGHATHESYTNFTWVNGAVLLCGFDDPVADAAVRDTFRQLVPDRQLVQIDATAIFAVGGGIHCITCHEPAAATCHLAVPTGMVDQGAER